MIKTEVLSVGTELLMGQIANTDAQYISARLPDAGAGVYYHTVVGDNPGRLRECLKIALGRCDVVITTGGLGPTQDDLTKIEIASFLGLHLIEDKESKDRIDAFFRARGVTPTENNYRQSLVPEGSEVLQNDNGTAPGCIIHCAGQYSGKSVVMLPGPPGELKPMFEKYVMDHFERLRDMENESKLFIRSCFVRICGTGESAVETRLMGLIDGQTNPTYATYAKEGIVTVRITASADTPKKAEEMIKNGAGEIVRILGRDVYSLNDEEPEQALINILKKYSLTLSTAESLTGGMIGEKLTSVPGASAVYMGGAVTYTDDVKHKLLGVKRETLTAFTAVSSQTCREMAEGICRTLGTDIGIAVTGYAGPKVDNEPVGQVFIGVCFNGRTFVKEFRFSGNRAKIRNLTVVNAIDFTRRVVLDSIDVLRTADNVLNSSTASGVIDSAAGRSWNGETEEKNG